MYKSFLTCWVLVLFSSAALANSFADSEADPIQINDFGWADHNYLEKQIASIDEIARKQLGTEVRNNLGDLELLQRIVDNNLISRNDTLALQALGAVLGSVMSANIPALQWRIYEDALGRSRALCVQDTRECLFPMTMLSRRMEKGLKPDVDKVYEDAIELVSAFLPHYPYGGGVMRKLHK